MTRLRTLFAGILLAAIGSGANADTFVTGSTGGNTAFSNYQPSLVLTQSIASSGIFPPRDGGAALPYIAMVHSFAGNFSPFNMPMAQGQLMAISQNTAFFSLVGTLYGGNGSTNFAVPNLVGKTPIGAGQGPALPNFQVGQDVGSAMVTLGVANMPAHDHQIAPFGPSSTVGGNAPFDNYQPSLAMTYLIAADGIYPSPDSGGLHTMIGEVGLFAGNFAPGGWLRADGSVLPISQYSALFSIIGTTFGGDGSSTFALPDLRGRAIVGAGQGPGLSPVQLGELTGMPVVSLTEAQMASHSHDASGFGGTTSVEGGGQPFSTEQPGLGLNYLIALQGVFPSRDSGNGSVPDMEPYLGEVIPFAGSFAPRGWALAQGQLLPINQNQALFSLLGTTYGGDGRINFALPDLRGRVVLGAGTGFVLGERLGTETTTLSVANLPAHTHSIDIAAVPEPGSWAMMIAGFALAGGMMRRRVTLRFA